MEHSELLKAMKHLQVETGSLACLGCSHEHACSVHGCAILRAAVKELSGSTSTGKPLTQADIDKMHFERVWIDYGPTPDNSEERAGEEGVVLYGKLYSVDTLEGAGFEQMLLDAAEGETLDCPSGIYTVYRIREGKRLIDPEEVKRTVRKIVKRLSESKLYPVNKSRILIEAFDEIIDAVPTWGKE